MQGTNSEMAGLYGKSMSVNNFRGIEASNLQIKRVNVIIGKNGSGKTSLLEAVFLFTLLKSTYTDEVVLTWLSHVFQSRGDLVSSIVTLQDSAVSVDGETLTIKRKFGGIEMNLNGSTVARVYFRPSAEGNAYSLSVELNRGGIEGEYTPVYISTRFDSVNIPETIVSMAKKKAKLEGLDILREDLTGAYLLHKDGIPVYVLGRGTLKRLLIEAATKFADVILIDEIEDSLFPLESFKVLAKEIAESNSTFFVVTQSHEMLRAIYDSIKEISVIIMKDRKARSCSDPESVDSLMAMDNPLGWVYFV